MNNIEPDSDEMLKLKENKITIQKMSISNRILTTNNEPIKVNLDKIIEFLDKHNLYNLEYKKGRFINCLEIKLEENNITRAKVFESGSLLIDCTNKVNYDKLNIIICDIIKTSNHIDVDWVVSNSKLSMIIYRYKFSSDIDTDCPSFSLIGPVIKNENNCIIIKKSRSGDKTRIFILRNGYVMYCSSSLTEIINKHELLLGIVFESQNRRIS